MAGLCREAKGRVTDVDDSPPLQILGPVSVHVGGVVVPVGGPTARRLLAVLILSRNAVVHVDRLVDALWGGAAPVTATATVRSHLSRLRRQLPPSVELKGIAPGYRLEVPSGDVDSERFESALGAVLNVVQEAPEAALNGLEAALGLWRGNALAEFADEWWAQGEAARLEELRLYASEVRLDALVALGRVELAIGEARLLTTQHPERERAWIALVTGLAASGRKRDALRGANAYRVKLRESWGLDPSAAFDALERDVAVGAPHLGGAEVTPARKTETPSGGVCLPDQPTSFHGRGAEGEKVSALLVAERMVTLLGAGGIGKTRLALHAAAVAAPAFQDGVWFSTFADLVGEDPNSVPFAVAAAIGVRPEQGTPMVDTLASWIGKRRVLVVLDNCEHVRVAAAALAGVLLRACPALTLLATSREPLRLPGETRTFVGPLEPEAAQALFVDRLRSFDASVAATVPAEDVAELCDRLGNMPLAIELAAARCRAVSPGELASRLEQRPELLADRSRPSAHQTLAAVLDWSVDHLDTTTRHVFARLSVFQGGCTLQQAEQVVSGGDVEEADVLEALGSLVDVGLVTVAGITPVVRYYQLEPIRQHGARLLGSDDRAELALRHAVGFAELAAAIGRGLEGPDFGLWADVADRELANLRAAHRWAIRSGRAEVAVGIVGGLCQYMHQRVMTEICEWNDATVAMTRGQGPELEAAALAPAAVGWFHQRRYREAIDAFERIRATLPTNPDLVAQAAYAAGWSSMNSHNRTDAEAFWTTGLAATPAPWYEGLLRASLSVLTTRDTVLAATLMEGIGSPILTAWHRIWSAKLVGTPDRLAASEGGLAETVEETDRIGATHALGVALYCLGLVRAQLPHRSTGEVLAPLDRAIGLWTRLRIPAQLLGTLEAAAVALALRGAPEPAHTLLAAVDARGGTMMYAFRRLVEGALSTVPPADLPACQQRAVRFATIDDAASYARATIAAIQAEDTDRREAQARPPSSPTAQPR